VDSHFNDVLAFINSIQPPKYPKAIDESMLQTGRKFLMPPVPNVMAHMGLMENILTC
jgi:hypothetical protein